MLQQTLDNAISTNHLCHYSLSRAGDCYFVYMQAAYDEEIVFQEHSRDEGELACKVQAWLETVPTMAVVPVEK